MAVRFYFPAGSRCRLAQSQRCPTRRRSLANRYFGNRVVRPFMGLLALPRIFPAAAFGICCGARIDCDGWLDCFFAAGSLAADAHLLRESLVEERISARERRDNLVRSPS